MSRHYSKIGQNEALFKRIDTLWENLENLGLTAEEKRVLERHWKGFVKSGAKLPKDTIGGDGVPDFPTINPAEARNAAKGTVWAGNPSNNNNTTDGGVWVVPLGGDFATDAVQPTKSDFTSGANTLITNDTGSVIKGNLVLVGTDAHPIELNGGQYMS